MVKLSSTDCITRFAHRKCKQKFCTTEKVAFPAQNGFHSENTLETPAFAFARRRV
jgi:hypothetical protein